MNIFVYANVKLAVQEHRGYKYWKACVYANVSGLRLYYSEQTDE